MAWHRQIVSLDKLFKFLVLAIRICVTQHLFEFLIPEYPLLFNTLSVNPTFDTMSVPPNLWYLECFFNLWHSEYSLTFDTLSVFPIFNAKVSKGVTVNRYFEIGLFNHWYLECLSNFWHPECPFNLNILLILWLWPLLLKLSAFWPLESVFM